MRNSGNQVGVIIVGAGNSVRMGRDKIFAMLGDRELLTWSVETFQNSVVIDRIVIVLNKQNIESGNKLAVTRKWSKISAICLGGKLRQDSVKEGLLKLTNCNWVIIHDAARPFVTDALIKDGLEAAKETGSAIAAIPLKDTIKSSDADLFVDSTLDRSKLWAIQTPQIFRFDIIMKAYNQITGPVTDDASLVELSGNKVKIYTGSYTNIKITTPEDFIIAETIAKRI